MATFRHLKDFLNSVKQNAASSRRLHPRGFLVPVRSSLASALIATCAIAAAANAVEPAWPQFRGPNASGIAGQGKPPVHFNADSNLLWKTPLPNGISSPCISGNRIFLTALNEKKLETIAIDRADGRICWRKIAPAEKIEPYHWTEGSPAASTPATDGHRVFVYFGSCGLLAYDFEGNQLWSVPMPIPVQSGDYGSATSPIVIDGRVLLKRDQLADSCLLAFDAASGKQLWRADRSPFKYGYSTPVIWAHDDQRDVVVPGMHQMKGYDLKTGAERWTLRGLPGGPCTTPVIGDGMLYFAGLSPAVSDLRLGSFDSLLEKFDANKDSHLSKEEADSQIKSFFPLLDPNRDGRIAREEFNGFLDSLSRGKNSLLALRPGGTGDITETHVAWQETKGLPYLASPLFYRGRIYLVRDGGMVSCFAADSGKPIYVQERLGAMGSYYASPIAADGKIYFCSTAGIIAVVAPGDTLEVLARNELRERIAATPACAEDCLYIRTDKHLFAFAIPRPHQAK